MDPKKAQPVGKQPKISTGRILLLLACSFLSFRGVNSKTEITGHQALSRFTGIGIHPDRPSSVPVYGLGANPRTFRASGRTPDLRIANRMANETSDANKTKEEVRLLTAATPSVSETTEEAVSGSYEPLSSVALTPTDSRRLESSLVFQTPASEAASGMPVLESPFTVSHKLLQSSMASQEDVPASTFTPKIPGDSESTARSSAASSIAAWELLPSPSFGPKSNTESLHDKRDTFWSIKPTAVKPRDEDLQSGLVSETSVANGSEEASAGDRLVVATATLGYVGVRETTSTTVMFVSLATDRWSDEDAPLQQPSSDSQVRKEEFGLPAGTVAGIVVASIGFVAIVAAVLGLFVFRRFRGLGAKSYDNKYNGDSCSYLDSLQVSYINNHIELPKESSEEMFSLDNDSFLNSLEAMTMENYWAEDRRSTRV